MSKLSHAQNIACRLAHGQEATAIQRSAEGLAVNAPLLHRESNATIKTYRDAESGIGLMDPCINCAELLTSGKSFKLSQFNVETASPMILYS